MYLRLSPDEESIKDIFDSFFDTECSIERVRSSEDSGFDADAWQRFVETGGPGMCLPEICGGGGADLTTAAIVADLLGRYVAPIPFIEHVVATRLIASLDQNNADLPQLATGELIASMALQPLSESTEIVPAGAVANRIIGFRGGEIIVIENANNASPLRNTANLPIARHSFDGGTVIASGDKARYWYQKARSEWQALMAVALTGLGRKAVDIGVTYAKERYQFGVLIGSFQGIQHGFASAITNIEGSHFLSSRAIAALQENANRGEQLAGMAFLFASEAALNAAATSLQYHGGYGFAEEYDVQLYYRRAKGWPLQLGDPGLEYQRIANLYLPKEGVH
ncbi:MAG: acyl-CoA dehydrogenase [Acidimicrobiaceae bacterium]|jgi:alkylation response protein AidB-like acyl-CoA dehydrogenase|nr:acyl-CoA dehydrogenase [Acidimicrobiaceae bacterium]|tara:strand:+ start:19789 stop:20802 length:1014 start_codon:yes stop_codon:yes gene_type:complete